MSVQASAAVMKKSEVPALGWTVLKNGAQVLRLWDSVGPKWPQVAVLRLSEDECETFLKDPKSYVNGFEVFYPPVRAVAPAGLMQIERDTSDNRAREWAVVIYHTPNSTMSPLPPSRAEF